jgi:hypothetical protein
MILIKKESRGFVVNLFADYILEKIGKNTSTKIEVIDCVNLVIVKGKTNSKEVLDIKKIVSEFNEKFDTILGENKIKNTIDLIDYDLELPDVKKLQITLHNSDNCSFNSIQIDQYKKSENSLDFYYIPMEVENNNLSFTSSFPHGYSLNQGRSLYYLAKIMYYSIPSNYYVDSMSFIIDLNSKEEENQIKIIDSKTNEFDQIIESAILDYFDFDISKLSEKIESIDFYSELLDPLEEHPIIKKLTKEMIII